MKERCINLRDWESRRLLSLAAGETAVLVRPVHPTPTRSLPNTQPLSGGNGEWVAHRPMGWSWRNPVRSKPDLFVADSASENFWEMLAELCPFGWPGDTLVGREAWSHDADSLAFLKRECEDFYGPPSQHGPYYRADLVHEGTGLTWRSAATMPAWAARHRLTVVRVEVKRCADLLVMSGVRLLQPYGPICANWAKDGYEKRFPWATSHAWVLTVRKGMGDVR